MRHARTGHWLLTAASLLLSISFSRAQSKAAAPAPSPVSYEHIKRQNPNISMHVVKLDLQDPRVSVHVARGGADPDGDGPWLTTLMPASEIAEREHYDIAINGDFFITENMNHTNGATIRYVKGKAAAPRGTAMSDGQLWHRAATTRPYLEITSTKVARLAEGRPSDPINPATRQIVGGAQILVRDRKAVTYTNDFAGFRNPRTVVGLSKGGRQLTLLVVDGRQPELSAGMTFAEVSKTMIRLGCDNAINLDGGGSTTLVYREPKTKTLKILNSPSDGKERPVANVLGVRVGTPLPEVK